VYVTHRRGYRAGGLNPLAGPALLASPAIPNAASLFAYKAETLTDTEGGIKADWTLGDMSLRTNLAVYHDKLDKAQINQTFSVPVGAAVQTVSALTNAARAEVNGAEAEVTLIPVRGLELGVAYAYTNAFYGPFQDYSRRDPATNLPTLQDGRVFPFTPHHKLNVSVRADLPIDPALGDLSTLVSWSHKSTILLGLVPFYTVGGVLVRDQNAYQKPTNVIDVSLDWDNIAGSGLGASLFVTNLTNTTYKIGGASLIASLGIDQAIYNEPRMWGARVRYRFGDEQDGPPARPPRGRRAGAARRVVRCLGDVASRASGH
jgi:iron complex outermembrane receptor protein